MLLGQPKMCVNYFSYDYRFNRRKKTDTCDQCKESGTYCANSLESLEQYSGSHFISNLLYFPTGKFNNTRIKLKISGVLSERTMSPNDCIETEFSRLGNHWLAKNKLSERIA